MDVVISRTRWTASRGPFWGSVFLMIGWVLFQVTGCYPCGHIGYPISVMGTLVDSETQEAVGNVPVGGRVLLMDTVLDNKLAVTRSGDPVGPQSSEAGEFRLDFVIIDSWCIVSGPDPDAEFLTPDRLEVFVVRDECEMTIVVDINADTVVDLSGPDDVLQLREPIAVPPCDE